MGNNNDVPKATDVGRHNKLFNFKANLYKKKLDNDYGKYRYNNESIAVTTWRKITHAFSNGNEVKNLIDEINAKIDNDGKLETVKQEMTKTLQQVDINVLDVAGISNVVTLSSKDIPDFINPLTSFVKSAVDNVVTFASPFIPFASVLVGLGKLAYTSTTDRDKAHALLHPLVWSLIDSSRPRIENSADKTGTSFESDWKTAEVNSRYLMDKGAARYQRAYLEFINALLDLEKWITQLQKITDLQTLEDEWKRANTAQTNKPTTFIGKGGDIFEFMRRAAHLSNYMQASYIVHLIELDAFSGTESARRGYLEDDYLLKKFPLTARSRGVVLTAYEVYSEKLSELQSMNEIDPFTKSKPFKVPTKTQSSKYNQLL